MQKVYGSSLFWLLLLVFCGGCVAQETQVFREAKGLQGASPLHHFEKLDFSVGAVRFQIDYKGKGTRTDEGNRVTSSRLILEKDGSVARVIYFFQYQEALILLYEVETWDAGGGFIIRLDGETLKPKWQTTIPGFNVGNGLVEGKFAYIGASGFAAKIDLDSGRYLWKHENFYRKYRESGAFNVFEVPEIKGNTVIFTENNRHTRGPNVIKFDKETGKVTEVSVS